MILSASEHVFGQPQPTSTSIERGFQGRPVFDRMQVNLRLEVAKSYPKLHELDGAQPNLTRQPQSYNDIMHLYHGAHITWQIHILQRQ